MDEWAIPAMTRTKRRSRDMLLPLAAQRTRDAATH
jgi:hypothetical protein